MDPPAATTSERSFNSESSPLDLDLEHPEPEPERSHLRKAKTVMAREMRKKRITFGQNHGDPRADYSRSLALAETSPSPAAAAAVEAEAGMLRRGRLSAKSSHAHAYASSSANDALLPFLVTHQQRRYRSPIVITAIGVISFGMAACFLLGGQMLPSLTAPVPVLRKLRGAPAPRRGGFDQMATILRAETAGMPPEERKRVSQVFAFDHKSA